jgi:hypothetical protein
VVSFVETGEGVVSARVLRKGVSAGAWSREDTRLLAYLCNQTFDRRLLFIYFLKWFEVNKLHLSREISILSSA